MRSICVNNLLAHQIVNLAIMSVTIRIEFLKSLIDELKNAYNKLDNVSVLLQHKVVLREFLRNEFGTHQSNTQFMSNLGHLAKLIGYKGDINPTPQSSNATQPSTTPSITTPTTLPSPLQSSNDKDKINWERKSFKCDDASEDNIEILPQYKKLMDDTDLLILPRSCHNGEYVDVLSKYFYHEGVAIITIDSLASRDLDVAMAYIKSKKCVVKCEIRIEDMLKLFIKYKVSSGVKVVEVVNPPYEIPTITYDYVKM